MNNQADFDSAIRRFDPSRPSQPIIIRARAPSRCIAMNGRRPESRHRIAALREHLHAVICGSETVSGEDRSWADALIANLTEELDELILERDILVRDSS